MAHRYKENYYSSLFMFLTGLHGLEEYLIRGKSNGNGTILHFWKCVISVLTPLFTHAFIYTYFLSKKLICTVLHSLSSQTHCGGTCLYILCTEANG